MPTTITLTYITDEFARLFREGSFAVLSLLAIGIVLVTLEIITPERGRFAVSGVFLIALSAILRMAIGGNPAILFLYVALSFVVILAIFCVIAFFQKTAWITEALKREELEGMPDGLIKRTDYSNLLGLEGTTTSALAPAGQMNLGDTSFFVTSDIGLIELGKKVRVVEVRGENIIVQEIDGDD